MGGNWQIFQGMLVESGATQRLGIEVSSARFASQETSESHKY